MNGGYALVRGNAFEILMSSVRALQSTKSWAWKSLKGMRNRLQKIQTFITRHYIILTSLLYRVRTLTSHDTEESENSLESPHVQVQIQIYLMP